MKKLVASVFAVSSLLAFSTASFAQEATGTLPESAKTDQGANAGTTQKAKKHAKHKKHNKHSGREVGRL